MIPEKILKNEKREELSKILESIAKYWFSNIEIWKILEVNKVKISWLRIKKWEYPISLQKLEPFLKKAKEALEKLKEKS